MAGSFAIYRMHRRGILLSDRDIQSQEPVKGNISCYWSNDTLTRRYVHVASCQGAVPGIQPDLLPALYDAVIEDFGTGGARIRGTERFKLGNGKIEQFPQEWWIRFL